jgi:hypothetical protein
MNKCQTIEEFYINGSFFAKEKKVLEIWKTFCLKSPPLPELGKGSLSGRHDKIFDYFRRNFENNLCFLEKNGRFVIFGDGKSWLDDPTATLPAGKLATMIMGASEKTLDPYDSIKMLQEFFRRLKEKYSYDVVAWNQNREFRRKPFERLMKRLGAKQTGDCFYLKL